MLFTNSPYDFGYGSCSPYLTPRQYEEMMFEKQLARRRAEEAAYRRREEEMLRRAYQARRQQAKEEKERNWLSRENEEDGEEIRYKVIRGRDGGLYRVPVINQDRKANTQASSHKTPRLAKAQSKASRVVSDSRRTNKKTPNEKNRGRLSGPANDGINPRSSDSEKETGTPQMDKLVTPSLGETQRDKKDPILVEDASDSEYEEDELKSVWRNRKPSPGQWMEPVQGF